LQTLCIHGMQNGGKWNVIITVFVSFSSTKQRHVMDEALGYQSEHNDEDGGLPSSDSKCR